MMELNKLQQIVEGALFAAGQPLNIEQLTKLFEENEQVPDKILLKQALHSLQEAYKERAIELKELASGFQFQVKTEFAPWMQRLWDERPPRYSRAFLETLVLIAYRQPITRGEIEEIRGVAVSSHIMRNLTEREWIRAVGTRDIPGKPVLYATTKQFLDHFGLQNLSELPTLLEIQDLEQMEKSLQKQLELIEEPRLENKVEQAETIVQEEEIGISQERSGASQENAETVEVEEENNLAQSSAFTRLKQRAIEEE